MAVYNQHIKSPIAKNQKIKVFIVIISCILPEKVSKPDPSKYSLKADGLEILEIELNTERCEAKKLINVMRNVCVQLN